MVKIVKNICPHCGKAIEETKKDKLIRWYHQVFSTLGLFFLIVITSSQNHAKA